tara:strand:- start:389 stop:517 length:129 start_codon:yes stop_codon:yes gene_type:complete
LKLINRKLNQCDLEFENLKMYSTFGENRINVIKIETKIPRVE